MTELAALGLSIRSDGVVVATDRLKDFEGAGRRAEGVAGSLMRTAVALGTALAGAFSIRALGGYADAWSDMQSRVGAAIKDMEAAPALMQRITDIANASYSPLEQTAEIYSRNAGILRDLGRGATEAADFTEALNHALVTTATRGERAASVQNALAKAMAVGKLAGDGLETVLTHGSRVAEALADELGTNVSGLRALASQGKITGDVIASALINRVVELREEAGQMDATLGDAGVIANNVMTEWVGRIDKAWQASGQLATKVIELALAFRGTADTVIQLGNVVGMVLGPAFDMIGANMGTIASIAGVAVAALAGFYAPALMSGLWATSTALVTGVAGGIKAVTAAMLANPLGLLVAGLAAAVTAAFLFRDQIKQAIGVDVVEVAKAGGNMLIQAFDLAFRNIGTIWGALPSVLGDITISTANAVISGIQSMINGAIGLINDFTRGARDALGAIGLQVGDIGEVSIGTFDNPYANSLGGLGEKLGQNLKDTSGVDYLGGLASMLGDVWTNAAGAGDAIAGLAGQLGEGGATGGQGLAGAAGAANDKMKTLADDGLAKVGQFGQQVLSTLSSGFADMFKGLITGTKSAGEALNGLLMKLGDLFANQAFNMLFGGIFGGGLGGGIGGGLFGLPSFEGGGWTGNGDRSGGLDGKGGYLAMVHPREQIVDTTRNGGGGSGASQPVQITVRVEGARGNAEIQQMVAAGVSQGLKGYDRQLPNRMQEIQMRQG
jgi:tape measure domain-containing protein